MGPARACDFCEVGISDVTLRLVEGAEMGKMSEYNRPTEAISLVTGWALVAVPFVLEAAKECPEDSFCNLAAVLPHDGPHHDPAPWSPPEILPVTTASTGSTVGSMSGSLSITLA